MVTAPLLIFGVLYHKGTLLTSTKSAYKVYANIAPRQEP